MAQNQPNGGLPAPQDAEQPTTKSTWKMGFLRSKMGRKKSRAESTPSITSDVTLDTELKPSKKSTLGILSDRETDEVPGTVILLSNTNTNAPLGEEKMEHHKDDGASTISRRPQSLKRETTKRTRDGKFVLNPQPEDTPNDPLNWPAWRRDVALLCLGFYCMLGGGMTPVLAAGFTQVATTFEVSYSQVALTTGLYMMGLGVGSVIFSPTAYLFGKRTVYLLSAILFLLSSVWCALAPNYANLVVARVFQGIAVSPVECLPSATIAEIFFLHERAFRVGIYTLLLLGGKNLIPLVSAAIIQVKGWRWVFWVVAIVVGFGGILLFFFVPETFWDRTPRPRRLTRSGGSHLSLPTGFARSLRPSISRSRSENQNTQHRSNKSANPSNSGILKVETSNLASNSGGALDTFQSSAARTPKGVNVHFANERDATSSHNAEYNASNTDPESNNSYFTTHEIAPDGHANPPLPQSMPGTPMSRTRSMASTEPDAPNSAIDQRGLGHDGRGDLKLVHYTTGLRNAPPVPYLQTLKPWNGRISQANWFKVCIRPFILYAYPSVLWSSMVYALSVGWLIVLSEAVAHVYETRESYNFSSIQVGLVYISPFVGGVLGTAVAGRVSDVIVRFMARRNDGVYEPEFRLVMAIPIAICTAIGLMGFGWSAEEKDNFMVPTVFFGIISFGCCIGSTTAITFCVDSYRQFAAEALVTLNFSKNILHGLIWSLFFPSWLQSSGSKTVFLVIGGIQIACLSLTIPMYIYGKRARMWTVRMRMMEKF